MKTICIKLSKLPSSSENIYIEHIKKSRIYKKMTLNVEDQLSTVLIILEMTIVKQSLLIASR